MHYVYIILEQRLGIKYIGCTSDLKVRMKKHNSKGSRFTSKGTSWKLLYYEAFLSKKDALREEKFLKCGKGRERIKFLLKIR